MGLDVILFIPTGNPVFKRGQRIAPASDRLAMCRAAIADNPYFDVSDIEIAQSAKMLPITEIAEKLDILPEELEPYGRYKAKLFGGSRCDSNGFKVARLG